MWSKDLLFFLLLLLHFFENLLIKKRNVRQFLLMLFSVGTFYPDITNTLCMQFSWP